MTRRTTPSPAPAPTSRIGDKQHAREVARQLDRRRMRRRLVLWTMLLAVVAAAALYLRCGGGLGGLGLGNPQGVGDFDGQGTSRVDTGPRRCAIRVSAAGITVGGTPMPRDQAVAACKATKGADVVVTGDAREGDWKDLRAALEAAGVTDITVR